MRGNLKQLLHLGMISGQLFNLPFPQPIDTAITNMSRCTDLAIDEHRHGRRGHTTEFIRGKNHTSRPTVAHTVGNRKEPQVLADPQASSLAERRRPVSVAEAEVTCIGSYDAPPNAMGAANTAHRKTTCLGAGLQTLHRAITATPAHLS